MSASSTISESEPCSSKNSIDIFEDTRSPNPATTFKEMTRTILRLRALSRPAVLGRYYPQL